MPALFVLALRVSISTPSAFSIDTLFDVVSASLPPFTTRSMNLVLKLGGIRTL